MTENIKPWPEEGYPTLENYDKSQFEIENTCLLKYNGKGGLVKIPYGVTGISGANIFGGAFLSGKNLTGVVIPNTVTKIGEQSFLGCMNLESVTIPDTVTEIGEQAFFGCLKLKSAALPESLKSIGEGAFDCCEKLESLYIPAGVEKIGKNAFRDCRSLKNLQIAGDNKFYKCQNGVLYNKDGTKLLAVLHTTESFEVPASVIQICESAAMGYGLKNITIPESVAVIEKGAFAGCHELKIICRAKKKPQGWDKDWNVTGKGKLFKRRARVVWGM